MPNTGENNQQLQEQMQQRFAQIQAQIDELSEKLQESPHLALHLDVMVSETLVQQEISEEGRQAGEQKSAAVLDWIEGQKRKDALIKGAGTAATVILGLLALISGPLGWSGMAAAGLGLGAGAAGTATALYEQPQLDVQDLGAQAGEAGGQPLTSMDPEEARFNRILGRVNVVLGILDMGLEVGALSRLIKQPGALNTLAKLQPEQMTQFDEAVKLQRLGQGDEAQEILTRLRGEVGDETVDQLEEIARGISREGIPKPPMTVERVSLDGVAFSMDFRRDLSGVAQGLVRKLETQGWVRVDEISPHDLQTMARWTGQEIGVLQSPYHSGLRLVLGEDLGVMKGQILRGEQFVVHTHPVFRSHRADFAGTDIPNAGKHTEAVIDWGGNMIFFNKTGVLNPEILPGGPLQNMPADFHAAFMNEKGNIVGYSQLKVIRYDQGGNITVKVVE